MKKEKYLSNEIISFIQNRALLLSVDTKSSFQFSEIIEHPALTGHEGPIITTDFVITPEDGVKKSPIIHDDILLGFEFSGHAGGVPKKVINIDHHDSDPGMQRRVSSANLAVKYMLAFKENAIYPTITTHPNSKILVSHTDCDSITALAILSGIVDPNHWSKLGEAAIAADHTGEENLIADTLQGLDSLMTYVESRKTQGLPPDAEIAVKEKNLTTPLLALLDILNGIQPSLFSEAAKQGLFRTRNTRIKAREFINSAGKNGIIGEPTNPSGEFMKLPNNVYYLKVFKGGKIPTELLSGILPDAVALVEASPHKTIPNMWEVAYRAGIKFPKSGNFHNLDLAKYNLGGRWNAGSSGRSGGNKDPDKVANYIAKNINLLSK